MAEQTSAKMTTLATLSGAAFIQMQPQEIAALSKDELVRLSFRIRAIMGTIATYLRATETTTVSVETTKLTTTTTTTVVKSNYDIEAEAEVLRMTPQVVAALSKDELEQLALRSQEVLRNSPIRPGCRLGLRIEWCCMTVTHEVYPFRWLLSFTNSRRSVG
jgi:hypothetical protein